LRIPFPATGSPGEKSIVFLAISASLGGTH
jgi:hypothetical protein